jgi:hypothetical protein
LASWQESFGIAFAVLSPILGYAGYAFLPTNSGIGMGVSVAAIAAFLIAYPCVSMKKAKETARKFAQEQFQGERVDIEDAKLDYWTWHVSGWRVPKFAQPIRFYLDVDAKLFRGVKNGLHYVR